MGNKSISVLLFWSKQFFLKSPKQALTLFSRPGEARCCSTDSVLISLLITRHPFPKFVYTTKLVRLTQFLKRYVSATVVEFHWEGSAHCLQSRLVFLFSLFLKKFILPFTKAITAASQNIIGLHRVMIKWHLTYDIWHMPYDICLMTYALWHMPYDMQHLTHATSAHTCTHRNIICLPYAGFFFFNGKLGPNTMHI